MSKKACGDLLRDPRTVWFGSVVEELHKRRETPHLVTLTLPVLLDATLNRFQGILQFSSNAVGVVAFMCDRSQFGFFLSVNLANVRCPSSSLAVTAFWMA
jgi:hypothetical protein